MLLLRVWYPTSYGPVWLCHREPTSSLLGLGPGPYGLFDQLVGDMPTHLACPLLAGDDEGRRKPRQSSKSLAKGAGKESGSQDQGKNFQLSLDVSGFSPDELTVRMDGRKLTVTGKHEKKTGSEDGFRSQEYREIRRETLLPEDVDVQAMLCSLFQDGQLCIKAPHLALLASEERVVPISVRQGLNTGDGNVAMQGEEPGSSEGGDKEGSSSRDS